ncbi:MAG: insulinase family protein, partial [Flavobacteriaceae bacterium]|nr:insulinase family protein [Flavobacteriaceae bacterium]
NQPYGQILFAISENLFDKHPYQYKNIGDMDDLDAATLEEFNAYFDKYYVPNNAVLVVTGDIDKENTKELVEKYFSEVPKGPEVTRTVIKEDPITTTRNATFYDPNIQIPAVIAAYRTPGYAERDAYVLDMVSTYLSGGKSSVLYKKLVDEQQQALAVQAVNLGQRDYGTYALFGIPLGDTSLETLVQEMDEEIEKLSNELISERDFQKLQNTFETNFVNSNSSMQGIASSLATYYLLYEDVSLINKEIDIYRSITREEIRDAVNKYLNPNQRVVLEYLPEANK